MPQRPYLFHELQAIEKEGLNFLPKIVNQQKKMIGGMDACWALLADLKILRCFQLLYNKGHSMINRPGSSPTLSELALIKVSYSYVMFSKGFGTSGRNSQAFLKNRGNMFRIWLTPDELRICTKVHPGQTAAGRRMLV